ncbi:tryptophan-rich sensory protein [uncultured Methanolobus sp.]|uniref:tryptophan-rich sensory protein n=1 Tax=uncultured Methanolobus sp. TaxID=218300 RepID=UPI0029C87B27|nr:tryptophan-rich sensory protein [uncultured Methanolobus sp.]
MERKYKTTMIRIVVLVTFLAMITVNALANILPINDVTTGQLSDSYENLFAPAGFTFAIWGVIYFLLGAYTLYQLDIFKGNSSAFKNDLLNNIGILFSISSIANAAWIFSWHYEIIPLSMVLMVVILICLILINQTINTEQLSESEYLFIRLPFSVYFGWITVATIANATVLLVSLGWKGFGLAEETWAVIIIFVGFIIGAKTMLKNRDVAYGLVIVWAYAGILLKHVLPEGFGGQYFAVIITTSICIFLLLAASTYLVISKRES